MFQDDTLSGDLASLDLATKENLENLVKAGEELLKKPVARVNLGTGISEPYYKTTNEMALKKYITLLKNYSITFSKRCEVFYIFLTSFLKYTFV